MHTSDDDSEVVVVVVVVFAAAVVVVVVVRKIVGVGVGVVGVGHLIIRTKNSLSSSLIVVVVVVVAGGSGGREGGRKVGEDGRGEKKLKWSVRPRFLPRFLFFLFF